MSLIFISRSKEIVKTCEDESAERFDQLRDVPSNQSFAATAR